MSPCRTPRGNQQHAAAPGISPEVGFAPKRFSVFINDLQEDIKPSLLLSAGETKLGEAENNRVGHNQMHGAWSTACGQDTRGEATCFGK